ncbi:MAG: type II secretion system protein GspC [Desulfuromonas sp.]|nr:type II secretion system protein GspC [Desulfuromonas sp.]
MITLLHRSLPIYYLLLCALLGLSLAWLVTSAAEIGLAAHSNAGSTTTVTASAKLSRQPSDNRTILQRNIFNSTQSAEVQEIAPTRQASRQAATALAATNLTLIGTVVAGDLSLAVIKIDREIEIIRIQHKIPGHGTLDAVFRDHVEIKAQDGSIHILAMEDNEVAPASTGARARGNIAPQPATEVVHNLGNNRWAITTSEAEKIRSNIGTIIQQVRIEPNLVNGKTDGFTIKRIQRNSLLNQMGLMRGDILHAVNGTTLDSPEKGLQIFQQLREAKTLNLDLNRAGQSMKFQYEIK